MRTAVVRVDVDPSGELSPRRLAEGMATLREMAAEVGAEVIDNNLAVLPKGRRQAELLIGATDAELAMTIGIDLCTEAFGTTPQAGVLTYVSRGTDDDAYGVLDRFGLSGDIRRERGNEGFDIVYVTLRSADLEHIPESRIHTALEASLNCEVHILIE
jgi:hypothetical protein